MKNYDSYKGQIYNFVGKNGEEQEFVCVGVSEIDGVHYITAYLMPETSTWILTSDIESEEIKLKYIEDDEEHKRINRLMIEEHTIGMENGK